MNTITHATALVDAAWIAEHLEHESTRLVEVDVSASAYRAGHVPGAVLWNPYSDLRHPDYVPVDRTELEQLLSRSGIGRETTVVFYGYGAHLGYWLLRSHGHDDVRVLDGSREQWLEVGDWSTREPTVTATGYRLRPPDERLLANRDDVRAAIEQPGTVLLDVRSQAEYDGDRFWPSGATEDAARAGRLPGSVHLPIDALRGSDGFFRAPTELQRVVRGRGLAPEQRIVTYCTVGNRAAQAWFALTQLLGYRDVAVYHGSWAEWGHLPDVPIEV